MYTASVRMIMIIFFPSVLATGTIINNFSYMYTLWFQVAAGMHHKNIMFRIAGELSQGNYSHFHLKGINPVHIQELLLGHVAGT